MRSSAILTITLMAGFVLGGCNRDHSDLVDAQAVGSDTAAVAPTQPGAPVVAMAGNVSYQCDGGHRVEMLEEGRAQATLSDGRVVGLERSGRDAMGAYSGEAIEFATGPDSGALTVDELGSFGCRPAG